MNSEPFAARREGPGMVEGSVAEFGGRAETLVSRWANLKGVPLDLPSTPPCDSFCQKRPKCGSDPSLFTVYRSLGRFPPPMALMRCSWELISVMRIPKFSPTLTVTP